MEVLLFIKHLKLKGAVYYQIWMPLLIQFNKIEGQEIKLSAIPDVPKSTYYRVIDYGVNVFSNFVTSYKITKDKSVIKFEKCDLEVLEFKTEKPVVKIKQQRIIKPKVINTTNIIEQIILHLNLCTGKKYKSNNKLTISNINKRLNEGFEFDDFIKVIEIKSKKWLGTKMEDYLTPKTLFGENMESYLNEKIVSKKTKQENNYEQVTKATELGWNN
jgi:uncharacterized phage protein (TIGR02220 family)